MAATSCLKIGRYQCPCRAEESPAEDRERQSQRPVGPWERKTDKGNAEAPKRCLSFATDVEEAGMEGDGNGKPGEHEVGGVVEHIAHAGRVPEGSFDHDPDRPDRIFTDRENDECRDRESQND